MKKTIYHTVLLFAAVATQAVAQQSPLFSKGEKSPNAHHVGNVWLRELHAADSIFNNSIAFATFEADARLDWHTHPGGQILLFTDGVGYYQERGKPKQTFRKGDIVKCLPGVEHWHGGTPTTGVSYLASSPTQKGKTVWLQKVTNEEFYGADTFSVRTTSPEQNIIALSKSKWRWMQEFKTDSLAGLFHEAAVFVHMGGLFSKNQELDVIHNKGIVYKNAEIQETSVRLIDRTAVLLNKIRLTAIVGGNEVVNPFNVTEVYVEQNGDWKLVSLSFTKLLAP